MSSQDLSVLLRDAAGTEARGYLLGAEQAGEDGRVCAVLDSNRGPVFALGGQVELVLSAAGERSATVLQVRALQHRVGRDAAWYVLEIDEADRSLLSAHANRRVHPRARPGLAAPVEAALSAPDGASVCPVTVKDLSESGAGLILRPPEDTELLALPRLRLALTLPGDQQALDLRARLVFRRMSGTLLHYGVVFDALASPSFEETHARLAAWVAERQSGAVLRRAG